MLKGPNRYLFTYAIHIFIKSFAHTNSASWYVAAPRCLILSLVQTFGGLRSNITDSTFDIFRGLPNPPYCAWLRLPPFCLNYSISSYNPPSPHTRTPGEGQGVSHPLSVWPAVSFTSLGAQEVRAVDDSGWGGWEKLGTCGCISALVTAPGSLLGVAGAGASRLTCELQTREWEAHRGQHQSVSPLQC